MQKVWWIMNEIDILCLLVLASRPLSHTICNSVRPLHT